MRVLVTRPEPASARTAAELERRGHEPVLMPLMRATHHVDCLAFPPLPETAALAVTSAEAMRALQVVPEVARQHLLAMPVYAVGRATARAAREAGFGDIKVAEGDGLSLARLLMAQTERSILYLTGTPRSPDFEAALAHAGRMVDTRECYHMSPIAYVDADIARRLTPMPDAILVYSSETARHLIELYERTRRTLDWSRTRFLCLSEKIASALPEEFQHRSSWSMEPREDLLLLLL